MQNGTKSVMVDGDVTTRAAAQPGKRDRAATRAPGVPDREALDLIQRFTEDVHTVQEQIERVADRAVELAARRITELARHQSTPTRLVPLAEAAPRLGRTREALKKMISRGQIRAVRGEGGRLRFIEEREIQRYIERGRASSV